MIRQHIVFLTGAGISSESGIPTFRGKDGLWNDERKVYLASSEALFNDTSEFLAFMNDMRQRVFDAAILITDIYDIISGPILYTIVNGGETDAAIFIHQTDLTILIKTVIILVVIRSGYLTIGIVKGMAVA